MTTCLSPEFREFLVEAKRNTYASKGEGGETKTRDGGRELNYTQGNLHYRDTYYGFDPFLGEETVVCDGKVVWGMNYIGHLLDKKASGDAVYRFLKKVLYLATEELPYRGPEYFSEDGWVYQNESKGTADWFLGNEHIVFEGKKVYELSYHGGTVIDTNS